MRFLSLNDADREAMLAAIGITHSDELFRDVPTALRRDRPFDLPFHMGEAEVEAVLSRMAAKNLAACDAALFIGAGAYRHHVPAAVDAMIQRGEFLTSYTPYQPEVSQGTLQYLFEFQTQIAMITGMEIANASLYDGATATCEAVAMSCRITRRKKVMLSGSLHPHYRSVTVSSLQFSDIDIEALSPDPLDMEDMIGRIDSETACVVVQNPGFFGHLRDLSALSLACHAEGALLVVVVAEPVSLGLVMSPGEMGADIVVGEGQSIGNSLNFGGPGLGLFASREKFMRQMPGRLVGQTIDQDGQRGWVLTISTREQHIRREKATSNICTNAGLCALAFSIHLAMLGETGFTGLAKINHARAVSLANALKKISGVRILANSFFNEFAVRIPGQAEDVVEKMAESGILAGVPASRFYPHYPELADVLVLAATEMNSEEEISQLATGLAGVLA